MQYIAAKNSDRSINTVTELSGLRKQSSYSLPVLHYSHAQLDWEAKTTLEKRSTPQTHPLTEGGKKSRLKVLPACLQHLTFNVRQGPLAKLTHHTFSEALQLN